MWQLPKIEITAEEIAARLEKSFGKLMQVCAENKI